ncbi:PD-(D/E)XK nuclease family protein [cf. Phormidesmis sp. LEGE 11477]|uniref:PD-(D/E)XK nuclease family protein n=1 Tax=cf. Phormidesmis sp. LEGE 11477 TaxID=1828680 RepID=UPI0018822923|nr:PD-(D/E)XK nuclease family protein [cf. Phormidesmis sp. LEGE 11477]MBE9061792.1 PD-(D/E)XK nuclease family protein [cf. Phormidesmis sp. LEGE 11477]
MLPLSQSHLTLFESCPRKYQHVFFDALAAPSTYEQQAQTQWGSQFHLLMQQKALNLPIQAVSQADTQMAASLEALVKAAPEVFDPLSAAQSPSEFSQSEHRRTLAFNNYLLTVVYDLVVFSGQSEDQLKGHIFDWKTHQKPLPKARLEADWQTRLYQFVLCETSDLSPDQISMTYWFVRPSQSEPVATSISAGAVPTAPALTQPSSYQFDYDLVQHDQTRQDLLLLTDRLTEMRLTENFLKVDIAKGLCDRCPFALRCDRLPLAAATQAQTTQQLLHTASQLTAESVTEVPL